MLGFSFDMAGCFVALGDDDIGAGMLRGNRGGGGSDHMHQQRTGGMNLLHPWRGIAPGERDDRHAFFERDCQPLGGIPMEHEIDAKRFVCQRLCLLNQLAGFMWRAPGQRQDAKTAGVTNGGNELRGAG